MGVEKFNINLPPSARLCEPVSTFDTERIIH